MNMLQRDCEHTEAWVKQFVNRVPRDAKEEILGVLRKVVLGVEVQERLS